MARTGVQTNKAPDRPTTRWPGAGETPVTSGPDAVLVVAGLLAASIALLPSIAFKSLDPTPLWESSATRYAVSNFQTYFRLERTISLPASSIIAALLTLAGAGALCLGLAGSRRSRGAYGAMLTGGVLAAGLAAALPFAAASWSGEGFRFAGLGTVTSTALAVLLAVVSSHRLHATAPTAPGAARATSRGLLASPVVLGVAGIILVAATREGASSPSSLASSNRTSQTSYSTSTTAAGLSAGPLVKTFTFTQSAPGGYRYSGQLAVGDPEHLRTGLTHGSTRAGSACSAANQTDAVMPMTLKVTNDTSGFSSMVTARLTWSSSGPVRMEVGYSDGPSCQSDGDLDVTSTAALSPGTSMTIYGFVILKNYYSPAYPNGDASVLDKAVVTLTDTSVRAISGTVSVVSASGPGVTKSTYGSSWAIPLDGTAPLRS